MDQLAHGIGPAAEVPDISVVIPCYNEEENAAAIIAAAVDQLEPLGLSFEIVVIDNHSQDRTVEIVKAICASDRRVRLIVNSRNFGQMRSPAYAIYQTRGRAVIGLAADFQDPPELIPAMVAFWQQGVDIVLGVRRTEERVSPALRMFRRLSYWLASNFGDYPVVPNATGFGLYTRRVVEATRQISEPEPFFRGMLVETGYRLELIPYPRPPRAAGSSKNNFFSLLDFAMSALAGSSKRLLRIPMYIGAFGIMLAAVLLLIGAVDLLIGRASAGWFIAAAIEAHFAVLFGFVGLLGDNVRIISERTRNTPMVLEQERVNFDEAA